MIEDITAPAYEPLDLNEEAPVSILKAPQRQAVVEPKKTLQENIDDLIKGLDAQEYEPMTREEVKEALRLHLLWQGNHGDTLIVAGSLTERSEDIPTQAVFYGKDLTGINITEILAELGAITLIRVDFTGANLTGACLSHVVLVRCLLDKTILRQAQLDQAVLQSNIDRSDLEGAQLRHAVIEGIVSESNLKAACLDGANLAGARFTECCAVRTRFVNCCGGGMWRSTDLEAADFSGANIETASFVDVQTKDIIFDKTTKASAKFRDYVQAQEQQRLKHRREQAVLQPLTVEEYKSLAKSAVKANLFCKQLTGVNLMGKDATGASFCYADLRGSYVDGMDVTYAWFTGADLRGVDLSQVKNLAKAINLQHAVWDKHTKWPEGFQPPHKPVRPINATVELIARRRMAGVYVKYKAPLDLSGLDLSGADLRGMDLRGWDFTGANLAGADLRGTLIDEGTVFSWANLTGVHINNPMIDETINNPLLAPSLWQEAWRRVKTKNDPAWIMKNPKIGAVMPDGTVYAGISPSTGTAMYVMPQDSGDMNWHQAVQYVKGLVAHGQNDWRLPTWEELNHLYEHREAIGGFKKSWYLSSLTCKFSDVCVQSFNNGHWHDRDRLCGEDVRFVRSAQRAR